MQECVTFHISSLISPLHSCGTKSFMLKDFISASHFWPYMEFCTGWESLFFLIRYTYLWRICIVVKSELVKNINILRDQTKWCPNDVCFLFRKLRCHDIIYKKFQFLLMNKSINIKFEITYISNFPASFSAEFPYLPEKKIVAGNSKKLFLSFFSILT